MVVDEIVAESSEKQFFILFLFSQRNPRLNLRISLLQCLGRRGSTAADASVDRRADTP